MDPMKNPLIIIMIILLLATRDSIQTDNKSNNKNNDLDCKTKLDQCQTNFFDELKQFKFNDYETSYYQLCSSDGTYMRFVDCVRQLNEKQQCKQHREFCNKRGLKLSSYRYTWKANIVHDICYRTTPLLDQDFFRHEKCISEVLNQPRWVCDTNYYEKTKIASGVEACQHWKAFRDCVHEKVTERCGKMVANLSDYLFHVHGNYFSKYSICNLPGEPHTKCWMDLIDSIPRIPVNGEVSTEKTTMTTITTSTPRIVVKSTLATIITPSSSTTKSPIPSSTMAPINGGKKSEFNLNEHESTESDLDSVSLHSNLVREAKIDVGHNKNVQIDQHQPPDQDSAQAHVVENLATTNHLRIYHWFSLMVTLIASSILFLIIH